MPQPTNYDQIRYLLRAKGRRMFSVIAMNNSYFEQ